MRSAGPIGAEMNIDRTSLAQTFEETRRHWSLMTAYERFEQIVSIALSLIIAVIIVMALIQLLMKLLPLVIGGALDPLDHAVFQAICGMIMTLLISMEFKHSIIRVALRRESIIQVKL
jgi:hypothetical protein